MHTGRSFPPVGWVSQMNQPIPRADNHPHSTHSPPTEKKLVNEAKRHTTRKHIGPDARPQRTTQQDTTELTDRVGGEPIIGRVSSRCHEQPHSSGIKVMTGWAVQTSSAPDQQGQKENQQQAAGEFIIWFDVRYVAKLEVLHDRSVRVPRCLFCLSLVRCPEREVVAQELHDEGGVFVRLLGKRVELRNRIVERLPNSRRAAASGPGSRREPRHEARDGLRLVLVH